MADYVTKHASPITTIFLFAFFFLSLPVAGDSQPPYTPIDNIVVNCGFNGNSTVRGDTRSWVGDINSKFFPSDLHHNDNDSIALSALTQSSSAVYATARLSRSEFAYSFPVSPGQKFIRLYFYSASYPNFDRSKAFFSVKAGLYFTFLHDFNASLNADASGSDEMVREFCVCLDGNYDQKLNLTFTPANQDSYAFISGIEIVSMPTYLYYTPIDPNNRGLNIRDPKLIGQTNQFFEIENHTSLETVYRVNIGGKAISPVDDTGMFRTWSKDTNLLNGYIVIDTTIHLNYNKIPPYTAPELVYQTASTMGHEETFNKSYNLTWEYPADPGFYYMIRLHFCDIEPLVNHVYDRYFHIYIADIIAEMNADVFHWSGGKGIPDIRDYIVYVQASTTKKVNLSVKLQASLDQLRTKWSGVLLNGIEIFKLNDSNGNLAGQNPDPPPLSPILQPRNSNSKMLEIVIPAMVCSVVVVLTLCLFVVLQWKTLRKTNSSVKTCWCALYSIRKNKIPKTRNSNLPSYLCRYFSILEIKSATRDFSEVLLIGVGGFGNVYKGYIDGGVTQVAIKRLKPGSKQGAHEFRTEIEMLSQLRHLHLVPLIGYCNEDNEMILVYDYMSHGTLQSHLYGTNEQQQPLWWKQRLQICIGAAKGLHYLHTGAEHTIIHRDVKTTNILLDDKLVAKVSDFGLSKVWPTTIFKDYVTTMVKGSFGYLDPEYRRRLQLSEKSDVYSFGVVLCEVLCARPPLICTADKVHILLAEWVKQKVREKTITEIIDPKIKDEIVLECLKIFIKILVSCIEDEGVKRPSMDDVVRGLEFASQLQESLNNANVQLSGLDDVDGWLFAEGMCSNNTEVVTTNNNYSSFMCNKGISGIVFSELKDLEGR